MRRDAFPRLPKTAIRPGCQNPYLAISSKR